MVDSDSPISNVVGATLGLLALLLAFTFGMSVNRYNDRQDHLLDEVNMLDTTYLRSELIAEPFRNQVEALLRDYVEIRAHVISDSNNLLQMIDQSEQLLTEISRQTVDYIRGEHITSGCYVYRLSK